MSIHLDLASPWQHAQMLYTGEMTVSLEIHGVAEDTLRRLQNQAGERGLSLEEFLRREVTRLAHQRSWEEIGQRAQRESQVYPSESPDALIRQLRDG